MAKIVALVGMPGSGKTTLAQELMRLYGATLVQSTTTRPPRDTDLEGEYGYLTDPSTFTVMEGMKLFAWTVRVTSTSGTFHYGTKKKVLEDATESRDPFKIMILTPSGVESLWKYFGDRSPQLITPIFLVVHDKDVLRRRIATRDSTASKESIEASIESARDWLKRSRFGNEKIAYQYVDASKSRKQVLRKVEELLQLQ